MSTAMATEIAGVRVLTEVMDLLLDKETKNTQTVTDCIKRIVDETETGTCLDVNVDEV